MGRSVALVAPGSRQVPGLEFVLPTVFAPQGEAFCLSGRSAIASSLGLRVNSCCEYAYWCPASKAVKCYVHGGFDKCCTDEDRHECLPTMYGSEDGLRLGDGFMCYRCGNYVAVGVRHESATQPGFPRRSGPPRRGTWLDDPPLT